MPCSGSLQFASRESWNFWLRHCLINMCAHCTGCDWHYPRNTGFYTLWYNNSQWRSFMYVEPLCLQGVKQCKSWNLIKEQLGFFPCWPDKIHIQIQNYFPAGFINVCIIIAWECILYFWYFIVLRFGITNFNSCSKYQKVDWFCQMTAWFLPIKSTKYYFALAYFIFLHISTYIIIYSFDCGQMYMYFFRLDMTYRVWYWLNHALVLCCC